jgi:CHC2 zinc finger
VTTTVESLFTRYLDLNRLRGHRRGLVICPFHRDRNPSLSIDLVRGLFNCFGCGQQGGMRRFAELVGEPLTAARARPRTPMTPAEEVRREVLRRKRRAAARRALYTTAYALADAVREGKRAIASMREWAIAVLIINPEDELAWVCLAHAEMLELQVQQLEADAELELMAAARADRAGAVWRRP